MAITLYGFDGSTYVRTVRMADLLLRGVDAGCWRGLRGEGLRALVGADAGAAELRVNRAAIGLAGAGPTPDQDPALPAYQGLRE